MKHLILTFLLFSVLSAFHIAAQQVPFYSEDFSGNTIPDQWQTKDVSENDVQWELCKSPMECAPGRFENTEAEKIFGEFASSTAFNGYMLVDSDRAGELSQVHISELTTDIIDCTGQTEVYLLFYTHIATFDKNARENAILRVYQESADRWFNYELFPNMTVDNDPNSSSNPAIIRINISEAAANRPDIRLQWQWTGNFEFSWSIDDIALFNEKPRLINSIYHEEFAGGLNGWEVNYITEEGEGWEWYPDGNVDNGAFAADNQAMNSITASNGTVVMNYDYLKTNGHAENAPPFPYPDIHTELVSPTLDLSNEVFPLLLEFNQMIRTLNAKENYFFSSFAISIDNGETYGDPIDINPNREPNNTVDNRKSFAVPNITGEEQVKIKFTYAGDFYYWALDDIALVLDPPLAIDGIKFSGHATEGGILLNILAQDIDAYEKINIQSSTNNNKWRTIASINDFNSVKNKLHVLDEFPQIGTNYYRLLLTEANQRQQFSAVIQVKYNQLSPIDVIPNPAQSTFRITHFDGEIQIYDSLNRKVQTVNNYQANSLINWQNLPKGVYQLLLIDKKGNQQIRTILKQ